MDEDACDGSARLRLGMRLQELRESCPPVEASRSRGMTRAAAVREVAALTPAALAHIEGGDLGIGTGDLRLLLRRYRVEDDVLIGQLARLAREGGDEDRLRRYRPFMRTGLPRVVALEAEAREILTYHPTVVCEPVQTERYTRAWFETQRLVEGFSSEYGERNTELRLERSKHILTRRNPPALRVVLDEAALRTPVGDGDVMREQFRALVDLAGQDRISIRVLTFQRGYRSTHGFTLLRFGDIPAHVHAESAWGTVSSSDKAPDVQRFTRRFESMESAALSREATIRHLRALGQRQ
ncbi:DUF5753 domain-containing protein [Streptomyces sp. NPDC026672]|uniref:DUF5753 domain-containing protein n=1 Tax=unclassified Streptomyces TaxID=2593676 RepID=UPI0033D58699